LGSSRIGTEHLAPRRSGRNPAVLKASEAR
jgi:hypothetical protein